MGEIKNAVVPVSAIAGAAAPAAPEPQVDLKTLLASADPASGPQSAKVCATCHSFEAGGPNRVGNYGGMRATIGEGVRNLPSFRGWRSQPRRRQSSGCDRASG